MFWIVPMGRSMISCSPSAFSRAFRLSPSDLSPSRLPPVCALDLLHVARPHVYRRVSNFSLRLCSDIGLGGPTGALRTACRVYLSDLSGQPFGGSSRVDTQLTHAR